MQWLEKVNQLDSISIYQRLKRGLQRMNEYTIEEIQSWHVSLF